MSAEAEDGAAGSRGRVWRAPRESWASSYTARRAMQANRRIDTKPELRLRSTLHRLGLRFRRDHRVDLPELRVRVDVAFTRARLAVFVDGCFWHGCPEHCERPRANVGYWREKIERNRRRDRRIDAALSEAGWVSIRVWEHEDPAAAADAIRAALLARRKDLAASDA